MEENNNILYQNPDYLILKIKDNIGEYLEGIIGNTETKVLNKIESWTTKIQSDIEAYEKFLGKDKWDIFEQFPQVFKDTNFKKKEVLWTVNAALNTSDPELKRYQETYNNTPGIEIFNKFRHIVLRAEEYHNGISSKLNFYTIKTIEDLQQDFFNSDDMYLIGVIGLGIRSEFLFKFFPSTFSLMTRRSHWTMFILTSSEEFILQQKGYGKYKGKIRYVNQFKYDYPRFNFYSIVILKEIINYCIKFNVTINEQYLFGYVNLFISGIFELKREALNEISKWEDYHE